MSMNVILLFFTILGLALIGTIAIRIYKKQLEKPNVFVIPIVIFVGYFSLTLQLAPIPNFHIPLLPLGVWILYFFLYRNEKRWETYRLYAWLGFWGRLIISVTTLLAIPVDSLAYPKENVETYIANVEHATLIPIHPSATYRTFNKDTFTDELKFLQQKKNDGIKWFYDTHSNEQVEERFPYMLSEVTPKWGSGIDAIIYVEKDGKGLLISTRTDQYYFRSDNSFLEGAENK